MGVKLAPAPKMKHAILASSMLVLVCSIQAQVTSAPSGAQPANTSFHENNTAVGSEALYKNAGGFNNTALGYRALYLNTTGINNTADGLSALFYNTTGSQNTATGFEALVHNSTGGDNTAIGYEALYRNTTGVDNSGCGYGALQNNSTGNNNIAVGTYSGSALTTGDNNIDVGNIGVSGESNTIRIGNAQAQTSTFIAGISGVTLSDASPVVVDREGHLGTADTSNLKGEKGATGATGPPGPGIVPGSFLFLAQDASPPDGYVFVGTAKIGSDVNNREILANIYQKK
jgi:hypothetical protein